MSRFWFPEYLNVQHLAFISRWDNPVQVHLSIHNNISQTQVNFQINGLSLHLLNQGIYKMEMTNILSMHV